MLLDTQRVGTKQADGTMMGVLKGRRSHRTVRVSGKLILDVYPSSSGKKSLCLAPSVILLSGREIAQPGSSDVVDTSSGK